MDTSEVLVLDLELDRHGNRLLDVGAVIGTSEYHGTKLEGLKDLLARSRFVVGHNLVRHDAPYLRKRLGDQVFEGKDLVAGFTPHAINQLGISRVFQTPEIFPELSILYNVMIPAFARRDGSFKFNPFKSLRREKQIEEEAVNLLEDLGMADERHHHAGSLSRGNKRRLELAMCLIQHPKLLLLDEPTAGMARHDTNRTIELLKKIKLRGMTKVIIEHDMHVVFSLADRISVLAQGAIIAEGAPNEIKGHPKVREAYLGSAVL